MYSIMIYITYKVEIEPSLTLNLKFTLCTYCTVQDLHCVPRQIFLVMDFNESLSVSY